MPVSGLTFLHFHLHVESAIAGANYSGEALFRAWTRRLKSCFIHRVCRTAVKQTKRRVAADMLEGIKRSVFSLS